MTELVFRMPDNIDNQHHVSLSTIFVSHKEHIKERSSQRYAGGVEHKIIFHNNEEGNDFFRAMLEKGISLGGYVKEKEPSPHDVKVAQESKLKRTIKHVKMRLYGG